MFCRVCGKEIHNQAAVCVGCGVPTGIPIPHQPRPAPVAGRKTRTAFVLLGLFLGGLGIHNFYAGYTGRAVSQLLITIFTFWLIVPIIIVGIWVLIEVCVVTEDASGQILV